MYKEVKLEFGYCDDKSKFYRVLLVKEDINLKDLGCAIVSAFGATFEHNFLFKTNNKTYNPYAFMIEFQLPNDVLMDEYTLKDLNSKFQFVYDTGEYYLFEATVIDTDIEYESGMDDVLLIDGAGQGIWEDNIRSLIDYLAGKIDPNSSLENETYHLPWNFENEKYGDFDEFDLDFEKHAFSETYMLDREEYKRNEAEYFDLPSEEKDEETEFIGLMNMLYEGSMTIVKHQIKHDGFIKDIYEKLLENHKPKESKELIAKEFIFLQLKTASKGEMLVDMKKYKKALEKLIK